MPAVNGVGKPCAGEPHARFDGRELETEHRSDQSHEVKDPRGNPAVTRGFETYRRSLSPRQLSTLHVIGERVAVRILGWLTGCGRHRFPTL